MTVDLRLYALVDPEHAGGRDLAELSRLVAQGGATLVQLRDKRSDTRPMVQLARAIKAALAPFHIPLLVNDRVDVALASGADGVHVGQQDMAVEDARRLLGPRAIIGLSIKTVAQAEAAPLDLLDYVGVGGVFATSSKDNPNPPIGPAGLARIAEVFRRRAPGFPLCGIAGIDAGNAGEAIAAGADGVAVISALSLAGRSAGGRACVAGRGGCRPRATATPMTPIAVTLAGSDSGGGAGIQADLKTFSALGVYGASVITALTAQNTKGVTAIHDVPAEFVAAQIDAVFSDLEVSAVKIGMVSQRGVIETIAAGLERWRQSQVVLDPVMIATSGDKLLAPDAIDVLKRVLMPRALVVTPNLPEAAALLDAPIADTETAMRTQGERLLALGARAVLIKGGHAAGAESVDLLIEPAAFTRLAADRVATANTHGTGCTLSSAIAAGLAKGLSLAEAVRAAKAYVTDALAAANRIKIGSGHGPVHHFHAWW